MTLAELRRFSETAATPEDQALAQKYWREMFQYQLGGPGLHELMKELRAVLEEYPGDRLLVGEDDDLACLGNGANELHLVFNFPLMRTERITPAHVRANQAERLARLDALPARGWGCNTLGNHDTSRTFTRYATDAEHAAELARVHTALILTLRGTPFLYNGEEIGMTDLIITDPDKLRDTMAIWYFGALINDLKIDPVEAAVRAGALSRDKNRTPMQWTDQPNAGFCPDGTAPWLPVNPNYADGVNVRDQQDDPASLLSFCRRLIAMRKSLPALVAGEYRPLHEATDGYVAFLRTSEAQTVLVLLNFSNARHNLRFDVPGKQTARVRFCSGGNSGDLNLAAIRLNAYEVLIAELT